MCFIKKRGELYTHTQSLVRSRIAYISEPIYVYASHTPDVPNISQRPSKSGHFLDTLVPAYRAKLLRLLVYILVYGKQPNIPTKNLHGRLRRLFKKL